MLECCNAKNVRMDLTRTLANASAANNIKYAVYRILLILILIHYPITTVHFYRA
jgi:hypothetical protein